jgi:U3 small nucleolar RNA-associated protein 18
MLFLHLIDRSSTGVVNLYELPGCMSKTNPNPIKSIMNLTTAVDQIIFHPSSMLMAMASRNKKDALKMVHVPSKQVFSNWPTDKTPLGYVQCLSFSPGGGYFSVGNDKGKALLYKLKHFEEY